MQQLKTSSTLRIRIVSCISSETARTACLELAEYGEISEVETLNDLEYFLAEQSLVSLPEGLLLEVDDNGDCFKLIERIRENIILKGIIVILLANTYNHKWLQRAKELKVHDYYHFPFPTEDIYDRLSFLVKFNLIRPPLSRIAKEELPVVKVAMLKRAFDVSFSIGLLLVLSPLLLIVALCIRMESKGPVIYRSKRVGTGFKVFNFYKFRSMYPDAEKRLSELVDSNQYANDPDGGVSVFSKFANDPRVTPLGRLLRKTSIDELPQLLNILKGDMSIVGNRPLPLYEAELLTSNEWSWRFLAPSGLTGLWQISRRGRPEMSERERKKLDNFYAKKHCMLLDLKILALTLPASFQKSKV